MVVIYTRIDGRDIPVEPGPLTRVYFSEGCEEWDEPGFYDFWTMERTQGDALTGRFLDGYPGQRFEKTNTAQTATLIRPSLQKDLESWLNHPRHVRDAPCAKHGEVNGQRITIGRDPVDGHYIVEAQAAPPPTEPSS